MELKPVLVILLGIIFLLIPMPPIATIIGLALVLTGLIMFTR